jgi:hypothetical protein
MILDPNELDNTIFQPILQHQFIVYADAVPSYLIKKIGGMGFFGLENRGGGMLFI